MDTGTIALIAIIGIALVYFFWLMYPVFKARPSTPAAPKPHLLENPKLWIAPSLALLMLLISIPVRGGLISIFWGWFVSPLTGWHSHIAGGIRYFACYMFYGFVDFVYILP